MIHANEIWLGPREHETRSSQSPHPDHRQTFGWVVAVVFHAGVRAPSSYEPGESLLLHPFARPSLLITGWHLATANRR